MEDRARKREDQEGREIRRKLEVKARLEMARRRELEYRVRLEWARREVKYRVRLYMGEEKQQSKVGQVAMGKRTQLDKELVEGSRVEQQAQSTHMAELAMGGKQL